MTRIISLCNNKGGVGKTTSAVNLPVFLAAAGKKVLLVDFDPQANATISLGIDPKKLPLSVYQALIGQTSPQSVIRTTPFFDYEMMPASPDLAGAQMELANQEGWQTRLSQLLEDAKQEYDYVFIDSPPSLGLLTMNIIVASDEVLIPVQSEYLALEGLEQLLDTIELVKQRSGKELDMIGAFLTMYDRRKKLSNQAAKRIRRNFPNRVFDAVIPQSVSLAEAPQYRKTILQYDPHSRATKAYRELAEEIMEVEDN